MKYLDEYRSTEGVHTLVREIARIVSRPWTLMEVCGGQTHSILKYGLDDLLPKEVSLLHGPGCPVCVTPVELIDQAQAIAAMPNATLCSFGDMLRVPGSKTDLLAVKAAGADVRIVYSPLDAVKLAERSPDREIVFFAVGFETTAPATAMAVMQASARGLNNFSLLVSHVLVPPVIEAVLSSPDCAVRGFLAAGHVCAVMGWEEYLPIAAKYGVPIVVTGFEPIDILQGILMCLRQLEAGRAEVENQYARIVHQAGNRAAQQMVREVFEVAPRKWRGIGEIRNSGLALRPAYLQFDAGRKFSVAAIRVDEPVQCQSGAVLTGRIRPTDCPSFAVNCTPDRPLGAPMVSSEGACAAYFRYRRPAADVAEAQQPEPSTMSESTRTS